ncbi:metallophosphoesterase [Myxococcota bacterium]|nr:metallophosphoesterase [Myxococcota bacterium]MBU1511266.1 metallophosphoesterase [Myxococcota bacterium]
MWSVRGFLWLVLLTFCLAGCAEPPALRTNSWRFVVVGDLHLSETRTTVANQLVAAMRGDDPSLVLITGDLVEGGSLTADQIQGQLDTFLEVMAPLTGDGIPVYPVRGNREAGMTDGVRLWNAAFSGIAALPANGPEGETGLTYAVARHNALFIGLDAYVNRRRVNQAWLDVQLAANVRPHVFVFAHPAAFKSSHADILDDFPEDRNALWRSLSAAGARLYFCGHDHFFDLTRIDDGDGDPGNDVFQVVTGTGGAWIVSSFDFDGPNEPYTPVPLLHGAEFGYLLVEISGTGDLDREVLLTWKKRVVDPFSGAVTFVPALRFRYTASPS